MIFQTQRHENVDYVCILQYTGNVIIKRIIIQLQIKTLAKLQYGYNSCLYK